MDPFICLPELESGEALLRAQCGHMLASGCPPEHGPRGKQPDKHINVAETFCCGFKAFLFDWVSVCFYGCGYWDGHWGILEVNSVMELGSHTSQSGSFCLSCILSSPLSLQAPPLGLTPLCPSQSLSSDCPVLTRLCLPPLVPLSPQPAACAVLRNPSPTLWLGGHLAELLWTSRIRGEPARVDTYLTQFRALWLPLFSCHISSLLPLRSLPRLPVSPPCAFLLGELVISQSWVLLFEADSLALPGCFHWPQTGIPSCLLGRT